MAAYTHYKVSDTDPPIFLEVVPMGSGEPPIEKTVHLYQVEHENQTILILATSEGRAKSQAYGALKIEYNNGKSTGTPAMDVLQLSFIIEGWGYTRC